MITVVFIGGIRTHYIKINAIQKTIQRMDRSLTDRFKFFYIDSGQHYDIALNGFKDELNLHFDYSLVHGTSDSYGIACSIMQKLGEVLDKIQQECKIDYVAVMGDVTTTVIAALSTILKGIKVIHIESGARVKNGTSGEETYRTATDHMASLCFASTKMDYDNLVREGLGSISYFVGDVLYDYMKYVSIVKEKSFQYIYKGETMDFDCSSNDYVLSSLHHAENLNPDYLSMFFETLHQEHVKAIFIAHPRVLKLLRQGNINVYDTTVAEYIPYKENLKAIANASYIITDSGGIQREAYYMNKRCVVRSNMNIWQDLVKCGSNTVATQDKQQLIYAMRWAKDHRNELLSYERCFGDGDSIEKMLKILIRLNQ